MLATRLRLGARILNGITNTTGRNGEGHLPLGRSTFGRRANHSQHQEPLRNRSHLNVLAITSVLACAALYCDFKLGMPLLLEGRAEGTSGASGNRNITADELQRHDRKAERLWVSIEGKVWDITDFLKSHPGGVDAITENAGKDVTALFKGIHPPHTVDENLDPSWRVGTLDEAGRARFRAMEEEGSDNLQAARDNLFGVDSVVRLNDFEAYAKNLVDMPAWEYYSGGAETESAMRGSFEAFDRVTFRPRVMRDVRDVTVAAEILGVKTSVPFYVSPTASNALGQPLGEIAVTRGAGKQNVLQILSHVASKPLEDVLGERIGDQQIGWQLYMNPDRSIAEKEIRRAAELGAQSVWLTVDTTVLGNRIAPRYGKVERNPAPHGSPLTPGPTFSSQSARHDCKLQWDDIEWIKELTGGLPVVLKGIGSWEDVVMAKKMGADAVVLSNHGGRQLDFADAPLRTLYDVNQNAPETLHDPKFQVFLDGGIRRGTDVLKALCLGATAVGLGRPFIYAATGWGPEGVEKAIMILRDELEASMRLLGVSSTEQLGPEYLNCSKL